MLVMYYYPAVSAHPSSYLLAVLVQLECCSPYVYTLFLLLYLRNINTSKSADNIQEGALGLQIYSNTDQSVTRPEQFKEIIITKYFFY